MALPKMLSYALGRQLEYYDEAAIREIVAKTKADEYRFQTLIKAVVDSYPFQYKSKSKPGMSVSTGRMPWAEDRTYLDERCSKASALR